MLLWGAQIFVRPYQQLGYAYGLRTDQPVIIEHPLETVDEVDEVPIEIGRRNDHGQQSFVVLDQIVHHEVTFTFRGSPLAQRQHDPVAEESPA